MPCINILAHLYRWVQRSCFSSLPSSSGCPWAGPSGWVPGRLMDGAHPLWPTEFYLRLTSRCCHRPLDSRHLPHQSLSSTPLDLSASPPFLSPRPHMPPMANHFLCCCCCFIWASRHPSSLWHGRFPSSDWQTRWRANTRTDTHMLMQTWAHTYLFTASQIWIILWLLAAICWRTKKKKKTRAWGGSCVAHSSGSQPFRLVANPQ